MAFLFRSRTRSDLAKTTKELLPRLQDTAASPKAEEDLVKALSQIKQTLQGTQETESSPDQVHQLVTSILDEDLLYSLAQSIQNLPFEARKDVQSIFSCVLRYKSPNQTSPDPPAITHIVNKRPEVIIELCRGYEQRESAMPCGVILREALKHEDVAVVIMYDQSRKDGTATNIDDINFDARQNGEGVFWKYFSWVDTGAFEVSTDAFTTFKDLLTKHKQLVANYLVVNFDLFFSKYNGILMQSNSYVTKRQSIKLLGEILLDRANYSVMTAYVDKGEHLKLCMNLLKDDRKMVQYEGFHVFKVFVANPKKSVAVQKILLNNRDRLLKFLPIFLEDREEDDEQFKDEKSFLIRQIKMMSPLPGEPA